MREFRPLNSNKQQIKLLSVPSILHSENQNEEVLKLEAFALAVHYRKECEFYLNRIEQMNQFEIEAFIWNIVMRLDIIRGIFPGLHNEDPFGLNLQLESFENEMWVKINQYFHD